MFCPNCNNVENSTSNYCSSCGFNLKQHYKEHSSERDNQPVAQYNMAYGDKSISQYDNKYNSQFTPTTNLSVEDPGKNTALTSLILGILPFIGIGGLFFSIPAWILGNRYKEVGNGKNISMANAGKICGIINTILHSFIAIFIICIMVLVFLPTFMIGSSETSSLHLDVPVEYEENIIVDDTNYFTFNDINVV